MARLGLLFAELETADYYDDLYRQRLRRHQLKRSLRNDENLVAFDFLSGEKFYEVYRLNKTVARSLIQELEPYLPSVRSTSITAMSKVLTALAFYAQGSNQRNIGQYAQHNMAQQTVSKCIRLVTAALNTPHMRNKYIKFPQTQQERTVIKNGFSDKFGFPGVLGCVDGTHFAVIRPDYNEEKYFNQKQYYSLNTQIIADSDLNILSVDASHGGCNHDSYIWEQHPLRDHMEQLQNTDRCWLLGDSGYAQRAWMMTPILDAAPGTPDYEYTQRQKSAWNTVERTIDVLKTRWRCLLAHRVLHYDPITAGELTNACVILHNIANAAGLPILPSWELNRQERAKEQSFQIDDNDNQHEEDLQSNDCTTNRLLNEGRNARAELVNQLWLSN